MQKKKEKKIPVGIVMYESVHKEIMKRVKKSGMKLSPLITNLLMVWAWKLDKSEKKQKEYDKELEEMLAGSDEVIEKYEKKMRTIQKEFQEDLEEEKNKKQ